MTKADTPLADTASSDAGETLTLIELLFFAYRDFTGDPDAILAEDGFGRAHHRVVHFVHRNPGIRVADLLAILKITKQSLGRVLRQLITDGYIDQRTGATDRRERQLFTTQKGAALATRLSQPQQVRILHALDGLEESEREAVKRFLLDMVNIDERDDVRARTTHKK